MKGTKVKVVLLLAALAVVGAFVFGACGLNKIESISIKSGTLPEYFVVGEQPDLSELVVLARYSDGSTVEISADKLEIQSFSTDTMGAKTLKISYEGKQVSTTVMVYLGEDAQYEIVSFKLPQSISLVYMQNSAKKAEASSMTEFKVHSQHEDFEGYYVGSANAFKFLPHISVVFEGSVTPSTLNKYTSISSVYLQDDLTGQFDLLQENEVEDYVIINEELSTYHFTELAEGGKFRLTVRPAFMSEDELNDLEGPVSFEFTVIDAWNATSAIDISRFNTNPHPSSVAAWSVYKEHNKVGSEKINGLVLHNDIKLTAADIPSAYLSEDGRLLFWTSIYHFWSERDSQQFQFVGNYFTIDASAIPLGQPDQINNPPTKDAQSSLFGVMGDNGHIPTSAHGAPNGMHVGPVAFKNLSIKGNSQRSENPEIAYEQGLTLFRTSSQEFVLDNVIANSALTVFAAIGNHDTNGVDKNLAIIKDTKAYDTYSYMVLAFGAKLKIYNSELLRSGGPVIIAMQSERIGDAYADIYVDSLSNVGTDVSGGEGWFVIQDAVTTAADIKAIFSGINSAKAMFADFFTSDRNIFKDNVQADGILNIISIMLPEEGALGAPEFVQNSSIELQLSGGNFTTSAVALAEVLSKSQDPYLPHYPVIQGSNGGIVVFNGTMFFLCTFDGSGNPTFTSFADLAQPQNYPLIGELFETFFNSDYISLYPASDGSGNGKRIAVLMKQFEV